MKLSQKELADALDVARSTLSEATSNGYLIGDRWDVSAWAVHDANGRLRFYDVPDGAAFLNGASPEMRGNPDEAVQTNGEVESLEDVGVGMGTSGMKGLPNVYSPTSLLPPGEDYFRPVGAGGTSHVLSTAIEEDNATSHGALMVGGTGIGALIGWETTDRSAFGALIGALVGAGVAYGGMKMTTGSSRDGSRAVGGRSRQPQVQGDRREQRRLPEGRSGDRTRGDGRSSGVRTRGTH